MKKSLIVMNIFALFLTSCTGLGPTVVERMPAAKDLSCEEMIREFFKPTKSVNESESQNLKALLKMELSKEQITDFFKEFGPLEMNEENAETFRAIFLFSKEDFSIRQTLLKGFHNELSGIPNIDEEEKMWKRFSAHKKRVDTQKKKFLAAESTPAGKKAALEKSAIYENLYYNCKSQIKGTPTSSDLKQAKRLTYALTAGSLGSSILTYSAVHWEDEKNSKWFNELYFSLGIGLVLSFVSGKFVLSNPNLNPWKGKMPLTFLNNAVSDIVVSGIYGYVFNSGDAELEKKLKELEADPKAQEKLQELIKIAEENHLFEKHMKNTQSFFKDKTTNSSVNASDFKHQITVDDIDLDASREVLMEALTEQEYKEKSGMLATGSKPVDRYTYHRLYNLISVPTNIGLTILMKNQMCMSPDPKKGFAQAVGIYMGASILFDSLYFKGRKELINQ